MTDDRNDTMPDRGANRETYASFMSMTKWGVILVVVVLALMALFLV
jgi:hypothetical protein